MEDNRAEQMEALETLIEFNERLIKNMGIITKELSGERLEDTDKFFKDITDAINWEINVMNGTMSLLNEGKERINKEQFNNRVLKLGEAIRSGEDARMAEAVEELIPEFENLSRAAKEVME